jgi:hypothetical protein
MRTVAILVLLLALRCPAESNRPPAIVVIESVLIDGRPISLSDRLPSVKVRAGQEQLEIHYAAPGITPPNEGHFRYQVEGFDAAWIDAGSTRFSRLGPLSPGRYRFVVQSANQGGAWNENGATLLITVSSGGFQFKLPWLLVILLAAVLFGSLMYFLIYRRQKEEDPAA